MRYKDAQKRFGQNFLINQGVIDAFAKTARELAPNTKKAVEIGPGMGAITRSLLSQFDSIDAYEIDEQAYAYLGSEFSSEIQENRLTIYLEDAYQLLLENRFPNAELVVSNLPYNIGSRILIELSLLDTPPALVIGLQKEVGQRLLANGELNLLGGWLRIVWNFQKVMQISPGSYRPAPKVYSYLLKGAPKTEQYSPKQRTQMFLLLKHLLRFPNKTLLNNLKDLPAIDPHAWLEKMRLPITTRLSWENYETILPALMQTQEGKQ